MENKYREEEEVKEEDKKNPSDEEIKWEPCYREFFGSIFGQGSSFPHDFSQ